MTRRLSLARGLALAVLAASCAHEPPESFLAPTYSYLTPIRLNVASVEIQDQSVPEQGSVDTLAPVRATESLKQMARDRLVASGSTGRAVFVIERASIVRAGDSLSGTMAVRLDVYAGGDARAGFAETKVTRSRTSTDTSENTGRVLYSFNRQMMADMNVEFEFQVTHALKDWVQLTAGAAPPPAPVQSQDLAPP